MSTTVWRVTKKRHPAYDGTGARLQGARWNSSGRDVIYSSDSFAGAILEILVHSARPRRLPGRHHAVRIDVPDDVAAEAVVEADLKGWDARDSATARAFGDRWYDELRTAVLFVPSLPARPVGKTVVINPTHPDAARIRVSPPFEVPWDERLF